MNVKKDELLRKLLNTFFLIIKHFEITSTLKEMLGSIELLKNLKLARFGKRKGKDNMNNNKKIKERTEFLLYIFLYRLYIKITNIHSKGRRTCTWTNVR